jgi:hypothetical protein
MALEDCDQIYADLLRQPIRYECRSLAEAFIKALQAEGYGLTLTSRELPVLKNRQVAIVSFAAPIALYHYIIICRHDRDNYKVYSAFGNIFIRPFLIESRLATECNRILQGQISEQNSDDLSFTEAWNALTHKDIHDYFYKEFAFQCARLLTDEINVIIENSHALGDRKDTILHLFTELLDILSSPSTASAEEIDEILLNIMDITNGTNLVVHIEKLNSCIQSALEGDHAAFSNYRDFMISIHKTKEIVNLIDFLDDTITDYIKKLGNFRGEVQIYAS